MSRRQKWKRHQSKLEERGETLQQVDEILKSAIKEKLEEGDTHQSKFKKVVMSVFKGEDPNSRLFRADKYFSYP